MDVSNKTRNNLLMLGKFLFAGLLFYLLFKFNLIQFSLLRLASHRLDLIIPALGCLFLGIIIGGLRWHLLLKAAEIPLNFKMTLQLYLIGSFFSIYLPGAAGGDAIRALYIYRMLDSKRAAAILAIFADRVFSLFGLLFVAAEIYLWFPSTISHDFSLAVYEKYTFLLCFIAILVGASSLLFAPLLQKLARVKFLPVWIERYSQHVFAMLLLYRKKWLVILSCCLLSMAASWIVIIGIMTIADMFSFAPKPSVSAIAGVYANLSSALPITPGGLGIGEAVFTKVCRDFSAVAAPFATIYFIFRLGMMLVSLPGMFVYLLFNSSVGQKSVATENRGILHVTE